MPGSDGEGIKKTTAFRICAIIRLSPILKTEGESTVTDNQEPHNVVDPEDFNQLYSQIVELAEQYGANLNVPHLIEHLKIVAKHDNDFKNSTFESDNFLKMSRIESMMTDLERDLKEADLKFLFEDMKNLKGEKEIVKKKEEYLQKK
jgi:hypothetical protein